MNREPDSRDTPPPIRRRRRQSRSAARIAGAFIAAAVLTLLAAACDGAPSAGPGSSPPAGGSTFPSALTYSACMRSHGVPSYPDAASGGQLPKGDAQAFGVSDAQYQTAQRTCQHLLPTGGSFDQQAQECIQAGDCPPSLVQQMLTADRKLARCMRSHGVPNFPDPASGGSGGPFFPISRVGISEAASRTPQFESALDECARLVGDNAPESFG
jgi:hypothetical protein